MNTAIVVFWSFVVVCMLVFVYGQPEARIVMAHAAHEWRRLVALLKKRRR